MKLFNFFKKIKQNIDSNNGVKGLTHLEKYSEVIPNPKNLKKFEWRRKLKSKNGNNKYRIKYYGELDKTYTSLIINTNFIPQKLIAIDTLSNEEILLFDGCIHGYNAMCCNEFTAEQIKNRKPEKIYKDKKGNQIFEIEISTYYQINYDEELREEIDENGKIELLNGDKIEFKTFKRNACDYLEIKIINELGEEIEIISEELA